MKDLNCQFNLPGSTSFHSCYINSAYIHIITFHLHLFFGELSLRNYIHFLSSLSFSLSLNFKIGDGERTQHTAVACLGCSGLQIQILGLYDPAALLSPRGPRV